MGILIGFIFGYWKGTEDTDKVWDEMYEQKIDEKIKRMKENK